MGAAHPRGRPVLPHGLELIGDDEVAESYEGRRWQEARAQVQRVLREADIDDPGFFSGRVLLEIGPGPVGLPEDSGAKLALAIEPSGASGAKLAFAIEPLAPRLDHVADPRAVTAEVARVLRPGGMLILNVDVGGEPTAEEPHAFSADDVRRLVRPLRVERERSIPAPHGHAGGQLVVVAIKDAA